ncbi:hypothetical protein RJ640_004548 [Escallonia rubra]|uniref:Cyclic nucleotide-binding domain-containing protein n=1 Tax=Escallonia rubra TaxID=112253 RepID=A0AA88R8U8_9ASTE|nr:hypothetical protein RJ640_004548 [Escallonia rubra]
MASGQETWHAYHDTDTTDDTEDEEEEDEEEEDESSRECEGMFDTCRRPRRRRFSLARVLDPRATRVREWNRVFLLVCATGLFVDPLFFYALSISKPRMCLFVDGWFAITVTVLRCATDALLAWNMWLQLKMNKLQPHGVGGGGSEVERSRPPRNRAVALRYLKAKKGFLLDLFVILPVPQVTIFGCVMDSSSSSSGEGFNNTGDDCVPSSAVGACWYLLGLQRVANCLNEQCRGTQVCGLRTVACQDPIYYGTSSPLRDGTRLAWGENLEARSTCLKADDDFYGIYTWAVQLVTIENRFEKILFPIFYGIMTLSTFSSGASTTDWLEVVFITVVISTGLLLVTTLIGNIKVFLNSTTSKKQAMQLKMRNLEWWMRRRHLPQAFRQRVRNYERQRWAAMRGVDECEMIQNLPEGLRRDIKYHLCLDLVRQVPLFQHMDNLVLENICDRVKSLIFTKGETITREGDPVQRMLFIVRGHLQSSQVLRDGVESCCMLGPGNFSGDELLSWCLRRPFIERLPPSSSTLVTLETTEAFGLEAEDVKYVTQHFRYTFAKEKVKRSARYYSPGWRTWAAVAIQLAWRRYKHRLTLTSLSFIRPRRPLSRCSSLGEDRLRLYTALLTSPKPNQDDFDF